MWDNSSSEAQFWRRLVGIAILILAIIFLVWWMVFPASFHNEVKHIVASSSGLQRTITLYNCDGKPIQTWKTKAKVEDKGGTCYFLYEGRAVTVSGTFTIIEEGE